MITKIRVIGAVICPKSRVIKNRNECYDCEHCISVEGEYVKCSYSRYPDNND